MVTKASPQALGSGGGGISGRQGLEVLLKLLDTLGVGSWSQGEALFTQLDSVKEGGLDVGRPRTLRDINDELQVTHLMG